MSIMVLLPVSGLQCEVDEAQHRRRVAVPGLFAAWADDPDGDQGWQPLIGSPWPLGGSRHWPRGKTPPEQAWFCVFGERVPSGAQVSVVFSNPTGEQVPGRVTYVGELFWAAEVRGLHPQAAVVVGETHQSCDLRPFDQRPRGTGWFRPHGVDRRIA